MAEGVLLAPLLQGWVVVERPYFGIWFLSPDCILRCSPVFSEGLSKYSMEFLPDLQYLMNSPSKGLWHFCHVILLR
jgi:hypothetical protein